LNKINTVERLGDIFTKGLRRIILGRRSWNGNPFILSKFELFLNISGRRSWDGNPSILSKFEP
jgi:hypothetical protein